MKARIYRAWRTVLAFFRLDRSAVCEMSAGRGPCDFHDYPDSVDPYPWHFHEHRCARCGKTFHI